MSFVKGYQSYEEVQIPGISALSGATYVAHIRDETNKSLLAELTTASGGISVHPTDIMRFTVSAQDTAKFPDTVIMDVVRTDVTPTQYQGFKLRISVENPVTRI